MGTEFEPAKTSFPLKVFCFDIGKDASIDGRKIDVLRPGLYKFNSKGGSEVYVSKKGIVYRYGDWGTVRHEAGHQLVHLGIGILPSQAKGNFWFHEGMACYFEGTGEYRINASVRFMRLSVLYRNYRNKGLPHIKDILELEAENVNTMGAVNAYALSWSLIHFLFHGEKGAYRQDFLKYMLKLKNRDNHPKSIELFWETFKDRKKLESGWVKHVHFLIKGGDYSAVFAPIGAADSFLPPLKLAPGAVPVIPGNNSRKTKKTDYETRKAVLAVLKELKKLKNPEKKKRIDEEFRDDERAGAALVYILRKDRVSAYREAAAYVLGELGERNALEGLTECALKDRTKDVRIAAAQAIRKVNERCAPEEFTDTFKGKDLGRALYAVEALGEIQDRQTLKAVIWFLNRSIDRKKLNDTSSDDSFMKKTGIKSIRKKLKSEMTTEADKAIDDPMGFAISRNRAYVQRTIIAALMKIAPENQWNHPLPWVEWGKKLK
jgi:hypothetical protein